MDWTKDESIGELLDQHKILKEMSGHLLSKLSAILGTAGSNNSESMRNYRSLIQQRELSQLLSGYVSLEKLRVDINEKLNKLTGVDKDNFDIPQEIVMLLSKEQHKLSDDQKSFTTSICTTNALVDNNE